ncbi:MAG: copper-containing nitrite reductase [Dehalococcoidia bacterium]
MGAKRLLARWPAFVAGTALAAVALGAVACSDTEDEVIQAKLVPPPGVPAHEQRAPGRVVVKLEAIEKDTEIAPGVTYNVWSFSGSVPGPLIRVKLGDQVEVHLKNAAGNTVAHNIDLHAVNGPGGGAGATTVAPGEEKAFSFEARSPGLYVYHCAAGIVADHIANGMYGAILVEPADRLPRVDHEYYIGQSEYYTTGATGAKGKQELDNEKLLAEEPTYVVWNGHTKGLQAEQAIKAEVGDRVRLYVANGGPNFTSAFHVIGEIFETIYNLGSFDQPWGKNLQTIVVPPGGSGVVDFKVDVPGDYKLVDHAISRVSKGILGTLHVEGAANPKVFRSDVPGADTHDMEATPKPAATPTAAPAATAAQSGAAIPVNMKDNLFEPKAITVAAGAKVTFNLKNSGKAIHNMRIADDKGSYEGAGSVVSDPELQKPGTDGSLTWTAPSTAGTIKFRCDIHPADMTGTITVR